MNRQEQAIQAIRTAYPDLTIEDVQHKQSGQFNDVLVINGRYVFRFPKTQREAAKLATETALLKSLQDRVALPVPNPIYRSKETAEVGQLFMGYRLLPGEPFKPATLHALHGEGQLQHIADQLATFLCQMHTTPAEALHVELPTFRGSGEWRDLYDRFRNRLFPFMRSDAQQWVITQFEGFFSDANNHTYAPALIHGDFGPGNILYDAETRSISGIIDFSSAGWGDPAVDVASVICSVSYGEAFLKRFSACYPGIEALLPRARFYAGTFALQEALYGIEDGDQEAFESGIAEYR